MIRAFSTLALAAVMFTAICTPVSAEESEADAYVKYYSFFLGQWSVIVEGEEVGTWTVKMSPTGCSQNSVLKLGDSITHTIYGYDPVTRSWTGVGFSTDGSRWTESVKKKEGDSPQAGDAFDYRGINVEKDGSEAFFKMRLEIVDTNTIKVSQTVVAVQSDVKTETRSMIGKRKK
jgi:hypothetical protein